MIVCAVKIYLILIVSPFLALILFILENIKIILYKLLDFFFQFR